MRELIFSIVKKNVYSDLKARRHNAKAPLNETEIKSKLFSLLRHARENSPFYRLRIPEISYDTRLEELPILRKDDVSKCREQILSSAPLDRTFAILNSTSGSTGRATHFYSDARDGRAARAYRGDEFVPGYHFLDRQLVFWGAERDLVSPFSVKKLVHHFLYQTIIFSTYHMHEKDISHYVDKINSYRPKVICGYPSALAFIAEKIKFTGNKLKSFPLGIITSGEMLHEHQREVIENAFSAPVFDRYGCREFGHIANECSAHSGYHYDADDLIIEVVDQDGVPCKAGEEGRILVTDMNNYAFPMIRYDIGDRGALQAPGPVCTCGSSLPKLDSIGGRSFDVVHGVNGNRVSGTFWTLKFRNEIVGVESFQVRQESDFTIYINLKVNSLFTSKSESMIHGIIKEKLGDTKVIVAVVDDMEYSPTGKFKWVYSEINKI